MDALQLTLDMTNVTTLLVFVCTFLLVYYLTRKPKGIPPGPVPLPVIGNILTLLGGDVLKTLDALRTRYGDIYSLYIGGDLTIYLNGYPAIHDALVKKGTLFVDRERQSYHKSYVENNGIVYSNGRKWKEQRNFASTALQKLCLKNGGRVIENVIYDELSYIIKKLSLEKSVVDITDDVNVSVFNAMCRVLIDHRYDLGDKTGLFLVRTAKEMATQHILNDIVCRCARYPLCNFVLLANGIKKRDRILREFKPFIERIVNSDRRYDLRTFVSLYYKQIDESQLYGHSDSFSESQMLFTIFDMSVAGSETTANTICWLLIYLTRQPEIQDKIYKEISTTIGKEPPTLCDRKRLPYTQAVILEGARIQNVVPLAIPHTVSRDVMFHGYLIPKGCSVIANVHTACNDPETWDQPDQFRPERFLNEDQTEVITPKEFIPFSLGPRACLGESFARIELFIFVTSLMQNFKFLPETDGQLPEVKGTLGVTYSPNSFKVRIESR